MTLHLSTLLQRRRRGILWLLSLFAAANALVGFTVYSRSTEGAQEEEALQRMRIMMQVLQLIRQHYVDADAIDTSRLINHAMGGMVNSLDPFSSYLKPDEYSNMMESTEGEFGGLGVVVTVRGGVLTVISPMEGSPGEQAGLRAGDRIVKIEDTPTRDMPLSEAVRLLKGPPGSEVTISISRAKSEETREITITRELIEVPSVTDVQVLDESIGYLRITQFNEPTAETLTQELDSLLEQDVEGLIVDLRNNPGGLLRSAVDVCSLFLPKGKLIVSTEGREASQNEKYLTKNGSKLPKTMPVAILVNGGSASAAEIVAGCLQDWGRAVLVGEQTFGKGSVQNIIQLPDNSALRLTTAKYYTPSRRVIHEQGIKPDITLALSENEREERLRHRRSGEDSLPMDAQLQRAVDTLTSYQTFRRASRGTLSLPGVDPDAEIRSGKK